MADDEKLLVFISWSKNLAREVALALRDLIIVVFDPVVTPWVSDQDIELGSRSMSELGTVLERSSFGIIVVTRANLESQWINFEAGALSKKVSNPEASVIPLLIDFERMSELVGPLTQFQATFCNEVELLRILNLIGVRVGVAPTVVTTRFSFAWPTFKAKLDGAQEKYRNTDPVPQRSPEDQMDEILRTLRTLRDRDTRSRSLSRSTSAMPASKTQEDLILEAAMELERLAYDSLIPVNVSPSTHGVSIRTAANMGAQQAKQLQAISRDVTAMYPSVRFRMLSDGPPENGLQAHLDSQHNARETLQYGSGRPESDTSS